MSPSLCASQQDVYVSPPKKLSRVVSSLCVPPRFVCMWRMVIEVRCSWSRRISCHGSRRRCNSCGRSKHIAGRQWEGSDRIGMASRGGNESARVQFATGFRARTRRARASSDALDVRPSSGVARERVFTQLERLAFLSRKVPKFSAPQGQKCEIERRLRRLHHHGTENVK